MFASCCSFVFIILDSVLFEVQTKSLLKAVRNAHYFAPTIVLALFSLSPISPKMCSAVRVIIVSAYDVDAVCMFVAIVVIVSCAIAQASIKASCLYFKFCFSSFEFFEHRC